MSWLTAALPYVGGGVLGSAVTYSLTWLRERRRTLDAYRAPQRAAIGDIITATHELMMRELESRTFLTELVDRIRSEKNEGISFDPTTSPAAAFGKATLDAERAFQIGSLSIVDVACWEAMGVAYIELSRLRTAMAGVSEMHSPEDIEQYVENTKGLADSALRAVTHLVNLANQRISPVQTFWNRRSRGAARRRLGERYRLSPPGSD